MTGAPTAETMAEFHKNYPPKFARCRANRHVEEKPYAVNRPSGPGGIYEVTRQCQCGRLITRRYTVAFVFIKGATTTAYPEGYLAPKGSGGVDQARMNQLSVQLDIDELTAATENAAKNAPRPRPSARKTTTKKATPRRK